MSHVSMGSCRVLGAGLLALFALMACAVNPPVQEMSNARQAIQAARAAGAERHAAQSLLAAESLLTSAKTMLEMGNYQEAREDALSARALAVEARNVALRAYEARRE